MIALDTLNLWVWVLLFIGAAYGIAKELYNINDKCYTERMRDLRFRERKLQDSAGKNEAGICKREAE